MKIACTLSNNLMCSARGPAHVGVLRGGVGAGAARALGAAAGRAARALTARLRAALRAAALVTV